MINLPNGWLNARIADVCEVNPTFSAHERPDPSTPVTFLPMSGVNEETGTINEPEEKLYSDVSKGFTYFREGDVLFAKITPSMENGKAAIARNLVNGIGFGSTEFHVLRPTSVILVEYLFYYIRRSGFRRWAKQSFVGSAGQQRVPTDFFDRVWIPLPPLSEQQRIVEILREFDELHLMRRKSYKLLQNLFPLLFSDFLVKHESQIKNFTLSKFAKTKYGTSVQADEDATKTPVLRIPNVINREIDYTVLKYVELRERERELLLLKYGDILLVRTNGNPDYVGRSASFEDDGIETVFASYLIRVRLDLDLAIPEYVSDYLNSKRGKQAIKLKITTSAGQFNLNSESIGSLEIPLLPIELQQNYLKLRNEVTKHKKLIKSSFKIWNDLSNSIFSRAFTGKLTEKWREENVLTLQSEVRDFNQSISRIAYEQKLQRNQNVEDKSLPKRDGNIYIATRPINSNRIMLNRRELADALSSKQQLCFSLVGFGKNYFNAKQIHALQEETNLSEADFEQILTLLAESGLLRRVRVLATDILEDKQALVPVFRLLNDEEIENNTRQNDLAEIRKELESLL